MSADTVSGGYRVSVYLYLLPGGWTIANLKGLSCSYGGMVPTQRTFVCML